MTQAILTCLIYAAIPEKFYPSTRRFPQAWQNNASDVWTRPYFGHTPGIFDGRAATKPKHSSSYGLLAVAQYKQSKDSASFILPGERARPGEDSVYSIPDKQIAVLMFHLTDHVWHKRQQRKRLGYGALNQLARIS